MGLDSQTSAILRDLQDIAECFNLELPRPGGTLGEKLLDIAVEGIISDVFMSESDPDGSPWPPLSEAYAEWKQKQVGSQPMGYLYGLLSDPEQIAGERTITADSATMEYGISAEAKQEAVHFGVDRPFYGITRGAAGRIGRFLDDHLEKVMGR